jgi:hypothetical protein
VTESGNNGFMLACHNNSNLEVIKYLAVNLKMNTTHVGNNGSTGFIGACFNNPNLDIIKYLVIDLKTNIDHVDMHGNNGFSRACQHNPNLDVVRFLSEQTNITQTLTTNFYRFRLIIINQRDTNNYIRFIELLESGINKDYFLKNELCDLLNDINSLLLTASMIERFVIDDPFKLKFKKFVTHFNKLTVSVKIYYVSMHNMHNT